jgi:hypothetical protein
MTAVAGNITTDEAAAIANSFMAKHRPMTGKHSMRMTMKKPLPLSMAKDASAYYVFNVGEGNGYVVVSGSDLAPQVLGYADRGTFVMDDVPSNMQAWLDSYAEQIAYLEKTGGRYEAPRRAEQHEAINPLLTTIWGQDAPFNYRCPIDPSTGKRSVTGCVATALAQVMNFHKYPSQTLAPIPEYTTRTNKTIMPEIGITTIDWDNMLDYYDDYTNAATTVQKEAVSNLMLLCGQATEMDYRSTSSGATSISLVNALQHYFGYDKTARIVNRKDFTRDSWESLMYDELAAGRPVLYSGASVGGGHAFVVDGYDGDGLFHINWGWNGHSDNYFVLSILNPYNNSDTGASSTGDGFSFDQDAVVGIQYGTDDVALERFSVTRIINKGKASYTRRSSKSDFTGINIETIVYNMTGLPHEFALGIALYNSSNEYVGNLLSYGYEGVNFGLLDNYYGGQYTFSEMSFGKNLSNGDYYLVPVSHTENTEEWEPCWGSNFYRIKATISDNSLTLTEPTVSLSGTIHASGESVVGETLSLKASVTNSGSNFNDYVYLFVNNNMVGGRIFEVQEGETADFDIDYVPTASGQQVISLAYKSGENYVHFITTTVGGGLATEVKLAGKITVDNATEDIVTEDKVTVSVEVANNGIDFNDDVRIIIYKYNESDNYYYGIEAQSQKLSLAGGTTTRLTFEFSNLENEKAYLLSFQYRKNNSWQDDNVYAYFTTNFTESYTKGDANGDGAVDIADAVCIVNYVVGKPTTSFVQEAADADGDGVVDIADAVRIVNFIVGKIDSLEK